jgi:hypothetical protein
MLHPVTRMIGEDREADLIRLSAEIPPKAVHPLAIRMMSFISGER